MMGAGWAVVSIFAVIMGAGWAAVLIFAVMTGGRMGGGFDFCSDADELKVLTPTIDGDEKGWEVEGEGDDADDLTKLTMERVEVENDEAVLSARRDNENCDKVDLESCVLQLRGGASAWSQRLRRRGPRSRASTSMRFIRHRERLKNKPATVIDVTCETWTKQRFSILYVNIRGFITNSAELVARLRMMKIKPTLVCLNETFLNKDVKHVEIEGYTIIGRRDRRDGRKCGGVAVFALSNREESMTLVKDSESSERLWILIHSDLGPYLVGAWYRPPVQGEMETIKSLRAEWEELSQEAVGTILVGDPPQEMVTKIRREYSRRRGIVQVL
jgi:hypothetical protein